MVEKRASLEIIAPSVEEAVENGLKELGIPESGVDVEILDSGSKGLFGLGFRQARIRLTIKQEPDTLEPESLWVEPVQKSPIQASEPPTMQPPQSMDEAAHEKPEAVDFQSIEKNQAIVQIASETVEELLDKMKIQAVVEARWGVPEDAKDRIPLLVDIHGDDLSILIGPKGETLSALQYIAALIVSKEVGYSVPLVVDVEGYRVRRSHQIRQLARRMAEQAVRTGKTQVLEPMPAGERRLVHIELREHPDVNTESIGEEPRRKVTINPK